MVENREEPHGSFMEPEPESEVRRGPSGARIGAANQRVPAATGEGALAWAEQLDVHTAYQPALQPRPQDDVDFYIQAYEHLHPGTTPKSLREDFCGTSALPVRRLVISRNS